jgi:lipopolysaccharide export system permease protein
VKTPFHFSRYLIVTLVNWGLIVTLAVSSIMAIFDFTELFRRAATKSAVGVGLIFKMLLLRFPTHIQEILPFIVLFAAMLAFWRLNRNHELIVMRASGLSIWQVLMPMVTIALLIGIFDLVFLGPLSAKLMSRFEILQNRYLNETTEMSTLSETGLWLKDKHKSTERVIRVEYIDFNKNILHGISVYEFDPNSKFAVRTDAHKAYLNDTGLHLYEGWQVKGGEVAKKFKEITFATLLTLHNIQESFANPKSLPFWSLISYANLMEQSGLSGQRYLLRWHGLLAGCIWLGVMVMLAATFSLNPVRSQRTSLIISTGVFISFLLYFFRDMSTAMGHAGTIPSLLAAWAPTGLTAIFAATKLLYSEDG